MDKLVYLHELDSTRNTEEEIRIGQQALYEEIVINGNRVVMTFNQLTDAVAFLRLIDEEEQCNRIIELFKTGYIKLSSYKKKKTDEKGTEKVIEINTASQYIQHALEKEEKSKKKGNIFVFTGLPLKIDEKELRNIILNALRYSNPNLLDRYEAKDENDKKRVAYFKRYVDMLLTLSREKLANNPIKDGKIKSLSEYIELMTNVPLAQCTISEELTTDDIKNAIDLLNKVKKQIETNKEDGDARSTWINNMEKYISITYLGENKDFNVLDKAKTKMIYIAEIFIHLAYNYAVEDSIYGISKHYNDKDANNESFYSDFLYRLKLYWDELVVQKIHRVIVKEQLEGKTIEKKEGIKNDNKEQKKEVKIGWETAVRVTGDKKLFFCKNKEENIYTEKKNIKKVEQNKSQDNESISKLYEDNYAEEKRTWRKKLKKIIVQQVVIALIYIALFILMDYISGWLEDGASLLLAFIGITLNEIGAFLFNVVVYMIVFGGVTAWISEKIDLPDIIESIKDIWDSFRDIKVIRKTRTGISYVHHQNKSEDK